MLALKRRHCKRKRRSKTELAKDAALKRGSKNKSGSVAGEKKRFVVELEDLGADYLEELLRITDDRHASSASSTSWCVCAVW